MTVDIDHVGIAVRSLERSIERWRAAFGFEQVTEIVTNTRQRTRVVFLARPGSLPVKLVEPTDESSPVFPIVARGGGLHHVCFRCGSLDSEIPRLEEIGLRVVTAPEPGEAFENERIAFLYAGDGLNIELIDTDRRARRLPGSRLDPEPFG